MADPVPPLSGMTLVFNDEFDRSTLQPSTGPLWDTTFWWGGRTITGSFQKQFFIDENYISKNGVQPTINPFSLSDGVLTITANPTPAALLPDVQNYKWLSGVITSYDSFQFQYGYVEARIDTPAGRGLWPAFWLLRTDTGFLGEIDIMEAIGQRPNFLYSTIHYSNDGVTQISENVVRKTVAADLTAGFHVYAVDWKPDTITFYLDGVAVGQTTTPQALKSWMYLIANLSVGGVLSGNPDATTTFPAEYKVDYIRVWQDAAHQAPSTPKTVTGTDFNDTLSTGSGGDTVYGLGGNDTMQGGPGTNSLDGGAGDDRIVGGLNNDTLNGGTGADAMMGGPGDDSYFVDDPNDVVFEGPGNGIDTLYTSLNAYTLNNSATGGHTERLIFLGAGNFSGQGNDRDNWIEGGAGNDTLAGGKGSDVLIGHGGDDLYRVEDDTDYVVEQANEGTDTVETGLSAYQLGDNVENLTFVGSVNFVGTGNVLANVLKGGIGSDTLDGSSGADTLMGGAGDDLYIVNSADVSVIEEAGAGFDTARTTLNGFALGTGVTQAVDALEFVGTGNFSGTGNALNNLIKGGAGDDTLDGAGGADTLVGGAGNDVYRVDNAAEVVTEAANGGQDTVETVLNIYALPDNVENIVFKGMGAATLTGNALDNAITGGTGVDRLDGGIGADLLSGGQGSDDYYIDNANDLIVEAADNTGRDRVFTSLGNYTLASGLEDLATTGGGDFIGSGNELANIITGGVGNDHLSGASGNDTLIGGVGADTINGGISVDEAVFSGMRRDYSASIADGELRLTDLQGLTDRISGVEIFRFADGPLTQAEVLNGPFSLDLSATSVLESSATGDVVASLAVSDPTPGDTFTYALLDSAGGRFALSGNQLVRGATALDYEAFTSHSIVIRITDATGNRLQQTLTISVGDVAGVTKTGTDTSEVIAGTQENDTLDGAGGSDTVQGGLGNDVLFSRDGQGPDDLDGGDGIDLLVFDRSSSLTALSYTLSAAPTMLTDGSRIAGFEQLDFRGGLANDSIVSGALADSLAGGGGNDTLDGGAGHDWLSGGLGNDDLRGGLGNDTLLGDAGLDTLNGGDGDDWLNGGTEADRLSGGAGADTLLGGDGADQLLGMTGADTLDGGAGDDKLDGGTENDTLIGGFGNDQLLGGAGNDQLFGGDGNDTLDSGTGADSMDGGAGNDFYTVDHVGDVVIEAPGGGIDTIRSFIDWTIGAEIENLSLLGTANLAGTGNELSNVINGNGGSNVLSGLAGDDSLSAFEGNDVLLGGEGNDRLDGGVGADTMVGGAGDDAYVVDNVLDQVIEDGGGHDTLITSVSYVVPDGIDDIILSGSGTIEVTGNSLSNDITGNFAANILRGGAGDDHIWALGGDDILWGGEGNDTLDGGGGNDQMVGGIGDDLFIVGSVGDVVVEAAGEGYDTVETTVSFTLSANVEALTLKGAGGIRGVGNDGDNVIRGNTGNNVLIGGLGADTVTGGTGVDTFQFSKGDVNGDSITDFEGAGVAGGDRLLFQGYAAGASLSFDTGSKLWSVVENGIKVETFSLGSVTTLISSDFSFIA